jgi:flagellar motility protein MotE (MotC chaperone)
MIYGKNGKFITIKESELPLEQRMEKRLTSTREKKRASLSHNETLKTPGSWNSFTAYNIFSKFRLLPIVAVLSFVLVIIRIPNFFDENQTNQDSSVIATPAKAQGNNEDTASGNKGSKADKSSTKGKKAGASTKEQPLDPVLFTRSEIELLQELSRRRKELDAREQTIVQREGLLMAAENRLEARINELETVKSDIETLITKYDAQEEEKFGGLVAIYEKMKPKESARIFDELDIDILLEVFERMKASKSASILAKMSPERAKEITSRIAERREMPKLN